MRQRGSGDLTPQQVAALQRQLQEAGMSPATASNVLKRSLSSDLRRPGHLLAVWQALVEGLGGVGQANGALKGAGATTLLMRAPATLAANLAALRTQLQLDHAQLSTLVGLAPTALNVPPADLAERKDRYAALLGCDSRQQAVAWLAKHPAALSHPMFDPEQRLERVQALLGVDRSAAQGVIRTCVNFVTTPPATLERQLAVLAALLQLDRLEAAGLVARTPQLLAYRSSQLAATVEALQRVLGVSRQALVAAAMDSPSLLTVSVPRAQARHDVLSALAARSPHWSKQWREMSIPSKCRLLACSEAVVARLQVVLAHGGTASWP